LGEIVRTHRIRAGLSQEALSEASGVSVRTISDLERGQRPSAHLETVRLLASALDLTDEERRQLLESARPGGLLSAASPRAAFGFTPWTASIPAPATPLVGRARELEELAEALGARTGEIVTLTGPGGVGKTRLAIEVAHLLSPAYSDGAAFIALATVTQVELVPDAIARALGITPRVISGVDQLTALLASRELLLILDNLEQVIEAAPFIAQLDAACPHLTLLVTSRVRLRVSSEREIAVPPLSVADRRSCVDQLRASGANQLFAERARKVDPQFELSDRNVATVSEICRRLDGLPLAIELAASRLRVLTVPALLERLDRRLPLLTGGDRDLPTRLRTMRDAIAWSNDLLAPEEQKLFRRLAVFAGGCTLEAADAVASATGDDRLDVFAGITTLVEANLLLLDMGVDDEEPRYAMLETIRDDGLEQLLASGEEAKIRAAHAAWCLGLAEEAAPFWHTGKQGRWAARLDIDYDNLRAALAWLAQTDDTTTGLRMVGWLGWFWFYRNHWAEGRGWLERALAWSAGTRTIERIRVLNMAAHFSLFHGGMAQAMIWAEESHSIAGEIGDAVGADTPLIALGAVAGWSGDYDRSTQCEEEALAVFRGLGDSVPNAASRATAVLNNLTWIAIRRGDFVCARRLAEESLEQQRELGYTIGVSDTLFHLALIAYEQGERAHAAALCQESLELAWDDRALQRVVYPLDRLAILSAEVGQDEMAARLFGAAERLHELLGLVRDETVHAGRDQALSGVRTRLGEDGFASAWATGRELPVEDAVVEADQIAATLAASAPSRR
jgi:non-specific serine/threonine protein kinase